MKKNIPIFVFSVALIFALTQCMNKANPSVKKVAEAKILTHKAAVDSLMVDSNAVRKPLIIKELNGRDGIAVLTQNDMSELLKQEYPANGFMVMTIIGLNLWYQKSSAMRQMRGYIT